MKNTKILVKQIATLLLAIAMLIITPLSTKAAEPIDTIDQVPVSVEYNETEGVEVGTIRYVSQLSGLNTYYGSYWGKYQNVSSVECYSSAISSALSYIGVNLLPVDLAEYWTVNYPCGNTFWTTYSDAVGWVGVRGNFFELYDNYVAGEGSYSPVIIHSNQYSTMGHFMTVIGKVSESCYYILDPAYETIWTMKIEYDGSQYTLSYTHPKSGKYIIEKSRDILATQYYNEDSAGKAAKLPDGCMRVIGNVSARIKVDVGYLRDGCGKSYNTIKKLAKNEEVQILGTCTNKYNNLWLYVRASTGQHGYVYSERVNYITNSTASVSGLDVPSSVIKEGNYYIIKGQVSVGICEKAQVVAYVKNNSSGKVVLSHTVEIPSRGVYNLQASEIDKAMLYDELPIGDYTMYIEVVEHHKVVDKSIKNYSQLCASGFFVR